MEENILLWLQNNMRSEFLDKIMVFITNLGNKGILWIILSLLFLIIPKMRKIGIMTSVSLICDLLLVNILIKNIVRRRRPYEVIEGLTSVIEKQSDFSFPSGHTAASFAFAFVLMLKAPKKISVPVMITAVMISFTRLYLGVHYPTDIIGGIVIGFVCSLISITLVNFIEKKIKAKKGTL